MRCTRAFRKSGGKLIVWHGWADPLINATGSVAYYERMMKKMGGATRTQEFARLFMAPGVPHRAGQDADAAASGPSGNQAPFESGLRPDVYA